MIKTPNIAKIRVGSASLRCVVRAGVVMPRVAKIGSNEDAPRVAGPGAVNSGRREQRPAKRKAEDSLTCVEFAVVLSLVVSNLVECMPVSKFENMALLSRFLVCVCSELFVGAHMLSACRVVSTGMVSFIHAAVSTRPNRRRRKQNCIFTNILNSGKIF